MSLLAIVPSSEKKPEKASEAMYVEQASRVVNSVAELNAVVEALLLDSYDVYQEIFILHLMGIQNPIRHAAFLKERGVILNKKTTPELATVKAVYPQRLWKDNSSTMTVWKNVITALHMYEVLPTEVPQWLRTPVLDHNAKEVRGIEKVNFLLKMGVPEGKVPRTSPKDKFDALVEKGLRSPIVTMSAEGDLAKIKGCALLLVYGDQDEIKVLGVSMKEDLVQKAGLKAICG
jgi:hypothetical protein